MQKDGQVREIQCSGKEEFMAHVKKGVAEFALNVADYPEVYGVMCVVDTGEKVEMYQLGNERSLRSLHRQLRDEVRVSPLNTLGAYLIILGVGVLIGMMLQLTR
jgi:hypothetical protein